MLRTTALLFALFQIGCDAPLAAVPTMATATKDLGVCWRDPDAGDSAANSAVTNHLAKRLRGAGYRIVTKGLCDIQIGWELASKGREDEGSSYRDVRVTVRDAGGALIDNIQLEYGPGQVPTNDSDRLAILIVNAVNASAKLAKYAHDNAEPITPTRERMF